MQQQPSHTAALMQGHLATHPRVNHDLSSLPHSPQVLFAEPCTGLKHPAGPQQGHVAAKPRGSLRHCLAGREDLNSGARVDTFSKEDRQAVPQAANSPYPPQGHLAAQALRRSQALLCRQP